MFDQVFKSLLWWMTILAVVIFGLMHFISNFTADGVGLNASLYNSDLYEKSVTGN